MRTNIAVAEPPVFTHEMGPGRGFMPEKELARTVLTCLLFEDTFYEKGSDIGSRIADLVKKCRPENVSALAIKARNEFHLRHVPLFLARELARVKSNSAHIEATLNGIIQRPDELGEFISLYWKEKRQPLSHAVLRGLRSALAKFNAYELAKWDTNSAAVKLRDVLRLIHAKPENDEQKELWRKVVKSELETPDTWETELSAGKDKRETFTRLIEERKLGGLALLRNLRNCIQSSVDAGLLRQAIRENPFRRVLPYRFIAAAKYAPTLEPELDAAMQRAADTLPKLSGRTAIMVDISPSMDAKLSEKSDLSRMDAACGLAIMGAMISDQFMVGSFSNAYVDVPPRKGMALRDAIVNSQQHNGTLLGSALRTAYSRPNGFRDADRVIVVTDEQSQDGIPSVVGDKQKCYLVNVAPYKFGIADEGGWHRISGFSERIFDYIAAHESEQ